MLECGVNTVLLSRLCRENVGVLILRSLTRGIFYSEGRGKEHGFDFILSLGVGVYSRAKKTEKSQSPLFPVGGGAVFTNDWNIIKYDNKISDMKQMMLIYIITIYNILQSSFCFRMNRIVLQ